jgi:hypothetical protein
MNTAYDTDCIAFTKVASLSGSDNALGLDVDVYHPRIKDGCSGVTDPFMGALIENASQYYLCVGMKGGEVVVEQRYNYRTDPMPFSEMIRRTLHASIDRFDPAAISVHVETEF